MVQGNTNIIMPDDLIKIESEIENKIKVEAVSEINEEHIESTQKLTQNGDTFDFEPFLYPFKISAFSHSSSTMFMSISDDRYHQDHTFGIIWLLFSKQTKSPSIFQLHWSLKFLQNLKNNDGVYTEDVNKCIQMIQDNLIKQYVNLGISLKHVDESIKMDENAIIASTPKAKQIQNNFDRNMSRELIESSNKNFNFRSCGKHCGREIILKENASKIMSFTYNEMISKGPVPCMEEVNYNYNVLFKTYASSDLIKNFIKDLHLSKKSIENMTTEELLQFFDNIRKEYVKTIKKQIDKICGIENFVQTIDKDSFKAYITDDLMECLNKLGNSDKEDSTEKLID